MGGHLPGSDREYRPNPGKQPGAEDRLALVNTGLASIHTAPESRRRGA
jgi:hypothetical protein